MNAWLGRQDSNLDMAISRMLLLVRDDQLNPIRLGYISVSKHSNFKNRTKLASPELRRQMSHSEKNEPTSPIRSPELKSEMVANIGLVANNLAQRTAAAARLAEGEELGSNLLQVRLRSPARNYASGSGLATKPTYDLIFGVP
jgi:hypothetical protein